MYLGGNYAVIGLFFLAILMLIRNYLSSKKKNKEAKIEEDLRKAESQTISGIIEESADNIAKTISRANKIYTSTLKGLAKGKVGSLKKSRAGVEKLNDEIDELRGNIFYFIKNLEETSVRGSNFYIQILGFLEDITQSLEYIAKASYKHVNNNHKPLRFNQIRDLQEINQKLDEFLTATQAAFNDRNYAQIGELLGQKEELYNSVTDKIQKQVARTRSEESSPKNTTLYFGLLLETKDLIEEIMNLLSEIKTRGIELCIDDFGKGFSSLSYLPRFPIDILKIDRTFIQSLHTDSRKKGIVQTILSLAETLELTCVAEGVESAEQFAYLHQLGCQKVQGFLFAQPMPLEELQAALNQASPATRAFLDTPFFQGQQDRPISSVSQYH